MLKSEFKTRLYEMTLRLTSGLENEFNWYCLL